MNFIGTQRRFNGIQGKPASCNNHPHDAVNSLLGCLDNSGSTSDSSEDQDSEGSLRINHIQMKGTHNSYHVEPLVSPSSTCTLTRSSMSGFPARGQAV